MDIFLLALGYFAVDLFLLNVQRGLQALLQPLHDPDGFCCQTFYKLAEFGSFKSFRSRAKAVSRPQIFIFRQAECPARQERCSGCFSAWIARDALTRFHSRLRVLEVLASALVLPKRCHAAYPQRRTPGWFGNGPCTALGGRSDASACCRLVQMELGNESLASDFITSTHLGGWLPDRSQVRELEMDVRGVSFASLTVLLWKNVLVHPFHFTPGYSLAGPKLAVTSSRSAKTLLHTRDKINHSS